MAEESNQRDDLGLVKQIRNRLGDIAKPIPRATSLQILQRSPWGIEQFFIDIQYRKGFHGIQRFYRGIELPNSDYS